MNKSSTARAAILFVLFGLPLCVHDSNGRTKPKVTYTSECSCQGNHGISRWAAKTDHVEPPLNSGDIQPITPAEIYEWKGPGGNVPSGARRIAAEGRWYAVTGRLKKVKAEDDGDLHMILANANDNRPGEVVVEIPLGARWCELRKKVFSWTNAIFPFQTARTPFGLVQDQIITATGQAFYDIDHSANDTGNNRRKYDKKLAVWEIHPVMKLEFAGATAARSETEMQPQATPQTELTRPQSTMAPKVEAASTKASPQFVTIVVPTKIKIPYGELTLNKGTRLEVVTQSSSSVIVKYMGGNYSIPIERTELKQ
jgi:hypothetical protein